MQQVQSRKAISGNPRVKRRKKYDYSAFLWLAPVLIIMGIFSFYPPIYAAVLSFTDAKGGNSFEFTGFSNYVFVLQDPIFWYGMRNVTVFLVCGLILGNAAPLLLAELLFNLKSVKISNNLRFLFIIPTLIPGVINMMLWRYVIFGAEPNSIMNLIVNFFGMEKSAWYFEARHNPWIIWFSLIFTGFPFMGGTSFLIYLAGLQSIPESVQDAAKMDGCTGLRRVFKIDLRFLLGQIKYFMIMGVIGGIQGYGTQLLFTLHGEGYAATVPGYYMYDWAFGNKDWYRPTYGIASAVGMLLFVITLLLTLLSMFVINRKESTEAV